jgi:hypothetical protein
MAGRPGVPSEPWVVWSIEHDAWWRPGERGYTRELLLAGIYTKADAERHARNPENERAMPLRVALAEATGGYEARGSVLAHLQEGSRHG